MKSLIIKKYGNDFFEKIFKKNKIIQRFIQKNFNYLEPFEIEKQIGQGHYGIVFRIKGKDLTLKIGQNRGSDDERLIKKIMKLQKNGKLNFFKKILYFEQKSDAHIIISPRYIKIENGKLIKFINKLLNYNTYSFNEEDFNRVAKSVNFNDEKYIKQIYKIYALMQKYGFPTTDLHWKNIMLDKNGNLIVIDF